MCVSRGPQSRLGSCDLPSGRSCCLSRCESGIVQRLLKPTDQVPSPTLAAAGSCPSSQSHCDTRYVSKTSVVQTAIPQEDPGAGRLGSLCRGDGLSLFAPSSPHPLARSRSRPPHGFAPPNVPLPTPSSLASSSPR